MANSTVRSDGAKTPDTTALARPDSRALAMEVLRASGIGLLAGRVLIPTPRLVAIARDALAKVKAVESIDLVPGEGEVRIHLVLQMAGSATRVVVRVAVAAFHVNDKGGALLLRLLEPPTFSGKNGGRSSGLLGMIGTFGEAALSSMGPERILQTVAEFIGPPVKARRDLLILDLGSIPRLKKALARETVVGRVGEIVHVSGARFRPGGLEITLQIQRAPILASLRQRLFG
ncbi:MAG: hypothetical protein HYV09_01225 [Deltaproteobacteria bacterium]|nr:hypothetical protein [Deltaproteobacteria bacterium]